MAFPLGLIPQQTPQQRQQQQRSPLEEALAIFQAQEMLKQTASQGGFGAGQVQGGLPVQAPQATPQDFAGTQDLIAAQQPPITPAQQVAASTLPQGVSFPQQAPPPQDLQQETPEKGGFGSKMLEFLKRPEVLQALPTLIAGGVGLGVPGALPGAAGFASGFEGAKATQREAEVKAEDQKRTFRLTDEQGNVVKEIPIRAGDVTKIQKGGDDIITRFLEKELGLEPQERKEVDKPETTKETKERVGAEFSVGETLSRGGKNWKIVGFDNDGEPLVEEVK